jgi:hypothetical protein
LVVYSTLDMLSTYSFMYPLRLLGLEPADREANKLLAKLVRKYGVERGIIGYWFVETFGLLFLFLIFASATLYVPIGATSLISGRRHHLHPLQDSQAELQTGRKTEPAIDESLRDGKNSGIGDDT